MHVRAGLRVLYEEDVPLGGAPTETVTAGVVVVDRRTASRGIRALFTEDGVSTVAGQAVLLPRAALSDDTVEEATSAGALSVLVDGPLPAGAFSLDVPAGVPVVGLASDVVAEIRAMLAAGVPVTVAIGNVEVASREAEGSIAAFSSRGLVLDGSLKPDLAAPGVSVPTSEPGRGDDGEVRFGTISGTSAAAAVTAGVAAVLAQGRPGLDARQLHGVLVGSALAGGPRPDGVGRRPRRPPGSRAAGAHRRAGAAVVRRGPGPVGAERTIRITNVSTRRVSVSVGISAIAPKGVEIDGRPAAVPPPAGTERDRRRQREHDRAVARRRARPQASSCCAAATRRRCTCRGRSPCRPPSTSSRGSGSRRPGLASRTRRPLRCRSSRAR